VTAAAASAQTTMDPIAGLRWVAFAPAATKSPQHDPNTIACVRVDRLRRNAASAAQIMNLASC
jgi:uncharacterized protein involved in copper resistance